MKFILALFLFVLPFTQETLSQELPLPFPKEFSDWKKTESGYIFINGNKVKSFFKNSPEGGATYAIWHTGGLISVSRTEWVEFWKIYNDVVNLDNANITTKELEGFNEDEPYKSDGNFTKLRIGDLYMRVTVSIIVNSKRHFYTFIIDDEKFSVGHTIMR